VRYSVEHNIMPAQVGTGPEALPGGISSLHGAPEQGRSGSDARVLPMYSFIVLMALSALRGLLFAVAWMTAIFSRSRARRKTAFELVCLMLKPRRRR
jgi:hypothetical protein